jgi:hypothetical protein
MRCPDCGEDTRVIETVSYDNRVRRRRECDGCGRRFTTDERPRPAARFRPGDRVRSPNGSVGVVEKLAELQAGPNVSESNPLYVVQFEDLGGMKDVSAKMTAEKLEPVPGGEEG